MYNYQHFQREQKVANECKRLYSEFLQEKEDRKEQKKMLYNNHKKRVDAFIISAIQTPIEVDQYIAPKYQPRAFLSTGKVVPPFRMNSHTSSERLQEIMQKNSFLDGVPFRNPSLHKFRDFTTSSDKFLKFTPSCGTVRLVDHLINSRTNEIEVFDKSKTRKALMLKNSQLITRANKNQVRKLLMPTLHRKAYFNSIKSLLVQSPDVECEQKQRQVNQNKNELEIDKDPKKANKGKKMINEHINRKQNAINAMIKCRLLGSKCQSIPNKQTLRG